MADGLHPDAPPSDQIRVDRELPVEARTWGRILDVSALEAGDLILFRSAHTNLDRISRRIVDAQTRGGFHERHARWTHAAVYLGDDEHIGEASFWVRGFPSGVILRSIHSYCDGTHVIRARRPRDMTTKQRLRIAIGALRNLRKGYSFRQIAQFYIAAASGRGFWSGMPRGPRIGVRALVCSTLYQDAFNFAHHGTRVLLGTLSTPAHLSASTDFEADEPRPGWLQIE
jgi:hypothetical protein